VRVPNAEQALIDRAKLADYLLSPSHPIGRFKARFFNRLGFRADAWEELAHALRDQHVLVADAEAGDHEEFGQPFMIRAILRGPNGVAARVVSVWFVRCGEDVPRFVTAYPGDAK
jgi:hypothetical protein